VQQLRSLFDALCSQYKSLSDNKSKLEASCAKLRDCIDVQVQQIQSLNTEFEKLRQDFLQRRGERAARLPPDPPPPPPDEPDQNWELESFPVSEKLDPPLVISLLAEILDVSVICSTAFSLDGNWLAVGSDKTLRVYDIDKDDFLM
jgi:predicted ATPase